MPRELCNHLILKNPLRPCALARGHKSKAHRDQETMARSAESIKAKYDADPQKYRDMAARRREVSPRKAVWVGAEYRDTLRELADEDGISQVECFRRLLLREKLARDMARTTHD